MTHLGKPPGTFLTARAAWTSSESMRAYVALAVGLSAGSCSSPEETPVDSTVVRDSAGVEIVLDFATPRWPEGEGLRLSSRPVLQIGTFGGEETALYDVVDALRLEDGTIAVANSGSSEIKFFGATGEFLHSVGSLGDAPGEFQRLRKLDHRAADSLLLAFDHSAQRVTEYLSTGVLVRTVPLPSPASDDGVSERRPRLLTPVGWLDSGILVVRREVRTWERASVPEGETLSTSQGIEQLYLIDRDGQITTLADEVPGTERVARIGVRGRRMSLSTVPVPFLKTFRADAGGDVVVVGNTRAFDIRAYDAWGKLVRIIRRPHPLREVEADDRRAWIEGQLSAVADPAVRNRRRHQYEQMEFPSTLPTFESLVLAEDGQLWVEEFDPAVSPSDESHWSVYDQRGHRLGQVAMPPFFRPFEIGQDYVLGAWKDDMGIEYVRLYDLTSEGSS